MKKHSIRVISFLFILTVLYGCSGMSIVPNDSGCSGKSIDPNDSIRWWVTYFSIPTGADIYVEGQYVGTTPVSCGYPPPGPIGAASKNVVAKLPSGGERAVTCGPYTSWIRFDFYNNKAKINEYPTFFSVAPRTREVPFEKSESKSIIEAVINNDVQAVGNFIETNNDVEGQSKNGITPLFVAVETEKIEVAKLLLEKGASPNTHSSDGRFPLIVATALQNEELVEILLKNGAEPNMTNNRDFSPLISAAAKTNVEIFNKLIEHGADINHKSKTGHTPLMSAVVANNINMVKALVSKGANLDIVETILGRTPFVQAALKKHYEIAEYLLRSGADKNIPGYNGVTVRQHALNTNDDRLLEISRFNTDTFALWKLEAELEEEFKKYQKRKENYLIAKKEFEKKELKFLSGLTNKQLELYSIYTDNVNSNTTNIAKVLLSFRKFSDSLDNSKKNEFISIYSAKQKSKSDADLLAKMDQNLTERKKLIVKLQVDIAESNEKAEVEDRQAKEFAIRNQQQIIAAQNAQAAQRTQNTTGMLSILTSGLNFYNSIQAKKYNAQAAAYRSYSDRYESDRRNQQLIDSIKGVEDSIKKARRGLY